MIKLKSLLTEGHYFTKRDVTKIEKAMKKWPPQVRPLKGKIEHIEPDSGGKLIKVVFSKFSDENSIIVFMERVMGYEYKTFQRSPNRLWFRK